jgi:MFS family permease
VTTTPEADRPPPAALAAGGPDAARVWVPGLRLTTVGLVLLITLAASEALAVATVMPLVERDLGDLALYGWVFSAFFLGNLVGIVVAGRAADRMRPEVPLLAGLVLFLVGLVAAAAAPSMPVLVGARVLQGIGAGAIPAVAYVCIARSYRPEARPRMLALLSTAWVVPSLVGPGLAGVVGEQVGWRWVFGGLVPLVVVAGMLATVGVRTIAPPSEAAASAGPSLARAGQLVIGAALLLGGLDALPAIGGVVATLAGLGVGYDAFRRLTPVGTLRARPGLPATVLGKLVFMASFFAVDTYIPLALTDQRGVSATYAGLAVTATSLAWTAGSWVQERRIRRTGPRPLVAAGFACVAVGGVGMAVVLAPAVPVAVVFGCGIVLGLGAGLTYPPLSASTLASAAPGHEGAASSSMQLAEVLGVALGAGIGGVAVAASESATGRVAPGLTVVFVGAAALALASTALAGRLPHTVLRDAPRSDAG